MIRTRMEFMLTLECNWGCRDCCRGLESGGVPDSHVTPDQARRFVQHLRDREVYVPRLKVHGGDPVLNPWFQEIITYFGTEIGPESSGKLFGKVKVQTAYPQRAVLAKFDIPWGKGLQLHCEPIDAKKFKKHHVPWFVSPSDVGILGPDDVPPYGTELTGKPCELQRRCGRSFEKWGFTGCAQESVIGRAIGIDVYSQEYKHWADPRICRHCPMCLGREAGNDFMRQAHRGKFERVSPTLKMLEATPDNIVQSKLVYDSENERVPAWEGSEREGARREGLASTSR